MQELLEKLYKGELPKYLKRTFRNQKNLTMFLINYITETENCEAGLCELFRFLLTNDVLENKIRFSSAMIDVINNTKMIKKESVLLILNPYCLI